MKIIVTGCAGFIGSNFVDRYLDLGFDVLGIDNFSTGQESFLEDAKKNKKFTLIKDDLLKSKNLDKYFCDTNLVFHFSANADVRFGFDDTLKDINQNIIVTRNILEAMRTNNIKKIIFSSTGSVYGENKIFPTPENVNFPIQTSLYASSKVAAEGLITSYCDAFDFQAWIFRFVSILGPRYSHGHVFDFYKKLKDDSSILKVLGDGNQKKSYLHINDCISAVEIALEKSYKNINIFNLGTNEYCKVTDSISWITENLGINPRLEFAGGKQGWPGDNPFIFLDTKKIKSLGWEPQHSIKEGVISTLEYLKNNQWLLKI